MRDVLFCGKRVDTGEITEGFYFKATHHWHNHGIHEDWIATLIVQNGGFCNVCQKYAVVPESVGEYTGIKDKNGVKVFEHFIVKWAGQNFAVEWHHTKFVLKKDLGSEMYDYTLSCFDGSELEVIGTTYDNPELLKEV